MVSGTLTQPSQETSVRMKFPEAGRWRESTPALRDLTLVEFCAYRDAAGGVTRSLAFDAHGKH